MKGFSNEFTYRKFLEEGKEGEFDRLFEDAVKKAKATVLGKKHPMMINGKEVNAPAEITENSPIDGTPIGRFQKGTREHATAAINAAHSAFSEWSSAGYRDRIAIMRAAADIFAREKFGVAAIMSIENGKTRYESVGEVDEAIDFLRYYALDMEHNKGYLSKSVIEGTRSKVAAGFQGAPGRTESVSIAMKPYGVFAIVAPFNFPISISTGMSAGALITGNTVVFKPSSTDSMAMLTGLRIYEIFSEAGVPSGAFNYITGPGSELGEEFVSNELVKGIAFTGSRKTGMGMISKAYSSGRQKSFVVEMGGKNPVIVSEHADIDDAVSGVASAAFGYSGQKCSACSRVYVHESVKHEFLSKLAEKARSLRIGDPLLKANYIGPLISTNALEKFRSAVAAAKSAGRIVCGGGVAETGLNGIYVEPTVAEAPHGNPVFKEEFFVPFLAVDSYSKFTEALEKSNDSEYGLTAGLYSTKRSEINAFLRYMQAGVLYVNRSISATTGAIVGFHTFSGWKGSGLTGKGTGSRFYLQQFMREQSEAIVK